MENWPTGIQGMCVQDYIFLMKGVCQLLAFLLLRWVLSVDFVFATTYLYFTL